MSSDKFYMDRCVALALKGKGQVAPNPMVGAVIVHDGKIIGEGYHEAYGGPHAEVNAVNSVEDPSLLSEATIYVSLEPCAHWGKTPPCAELLASKQFERVVIGCLDQHDKVDGKGIKRLMEANIQIQLGVEEDLCREINKHFFTFHEKKRPYVLLKWAQSSDGLLDKSGSKDGKVVWISSQESQKMVHQWRAEYQSILVGKNTVIADEPSLTVRHAKGKNPTRIILDSNLSLTQDGNTFNSDAPTVVLNTIRDQELNNCRSVKIENMEPYTVLKALHDLNINSVLIEGGAQTLTSFIRSGLWDEARVFESDMTFGAGTKAPELNGIPNEVYKVGSDTLKTYFNR